MDVDRPQRGAGGRGAARFVVMAREHPGIALVAVVAVVLGSYAAGTRLWPSDRDEAQRAVEVVLDALVQGDTDAVLDNVSPYFSEGIVTRASLAEYLPRILERRPIIRAGLTVRQTEVGVNKTVLRIHVTTFHPGAHRMRPTGSDWTVELEQISGRWMVRNAVPISVNHRPTTGLWSVLVMGF